MRERALNQCVYLYAQIKNGKGNDTDRQPGSRVGHRSQGHHSSEHAVNHGADCERYGKVDSGDVVRDAVQDRPAGPCLVKQDGDAQERADEGVVQGARGTHTTEGRQACTQHVTEACNVRGKPTV